jgi:hypothetical protein
MQNIHEKGFFTDIYIYCSDSLKGTLRRWLAEEFPISKIVVISYGREDQFVNG